MINYLGFGACPPAGQAGNLEFTKTKLWQFATASFL
jgi:hypothetical protein